MAEHTKEPLSEQSSIEPLWKADAWRTYSDAMMAHRPTHVFALFSGGNDSTVLTHWAKRQLGRRLDAAVFIDTGTALPGVREFAERFCADREIPLRIYEAGNAYNEMVGKHGFPGPAGHRYAYVLLKERQVATLVREHKQRPRDRIMLLTGVRRSESVRRMGTTEAVKRERTKVWVAPLLDWTDADVRAYREQYALPESDVAAFICRSGECNCGAFAAPGEREMLISSYPAWWRERMAPLEASTGRTWGERPGVEPRGAEARIGGPLCTDCDQLRLAA
jgi:3'-phosphoadenosine 5'-phosphosulfate sulfotransferase (PAPS reductase)/FAD synthetase